MTTQRWVEIRYKCVCMSRERSFQVTERGASEEVLDFMNRVQRALAKDHRKFSPMCTSATVAETRVPAPGGRIGGAEGGTA